MGRVDIDGLQRMLDDLQQFGVLRGYERRPFGTWILALGNGEVLRPDTKETAMWAMGAMAGVGTAASALLPTIESQRETIQAQADVTKYTAEEVAAALERSSDVARWQADGAHFRVTMRLRRRQVMDALRAIDGA